MNSKDKIEFTPENRERFVEAFRPELLRLVQEVLIDLAAAHIGPDPHNPDIARATLVYTEPFPVRKLVKEMRQDNVVVSPIPRAAYYSQVIMLDSFSRVFEKLMQQQGFKIAENTLFQNPDPQFWTTHMGVSLNLVCFSVLSNVTSERLHEAFIMCGGAQNLIQLCEESLGEKFDATCAHQRRLKATGFDLSPTNSMAEVIARLQETLLPGTTVTVLQDGPQDHKGPTDNDDKPELIH
jgi:hypothetical protein